MKKYLILLVLLMVGCDSGNLSNNIDLVQQQGIGEFPENCTAVCDLEQQEGGIQFTLSCEGFGEVESGFATSPGALPPECQDSDFVEPFEEE